MHGGACWQALTDTAQRPGSEDWVLIARAGRDGASMTPRGEFDPGDSYGLLDIVTRDGCSYIAVRTDPDVPADDGSGWMLLASRGEKGAQGATANVSEFRLLLEDATVAPALELRPLFEEFYRQVTQRA